MFNKGLLPYETSILHLIDRWSDFFIDYLAKMIKIGEIVITDMFHLLTLHEG